MGQDAQRTVAGARGDALEQPVGAVRAHRAVALDVLALNGGGLFENRLQALLEARHDPVHAHHEVDRGRPCLADPRHRRPHLVLGPALAFTLEQGQGDPVRARRADRGRAADDEPLDRVHQSVHIVDILGFVAVRQQGLVDEREAVSGPADGAQFLGHDGALLKFRRCATPYMTSANHSSRQLGGCPNPGVRVQHPHL